VTDVDLKRLTGSTNSQFTKPTQTQKSGHSPADADTARTILARNVRHLRKRRAWSQEALAFEAGLDRTFVAHVERGARNISLDNIERLARAFLIPTHSLLEAEQEGLALAP
jgi:ribosome-binding protein aMBF1 (putative translation factor)